MAASAPTWCDDPSLAPAPLAIKRRALPVEDNTPPPPPIPPAPPLPPNEDQIARWSDECAQYLSMLRDWVPRLETVLEDDETPVSSSPLDEGLENPSDAPSSLGVGDDDKHDTDGPLLAVSIVDDSVPGTSAGCGANSRWEPPLGVCCEPAVVTPRSRRARVATLLKHWRRVRDRVVERLDRWRCRSCAW